MFIFASEKGRLNIHRLTENFYRYYQRRLDAGLPIDKTDSKISCYTFNHDSAKSFAIVEPLQSLQEKGLLFTYEEGEKNYVSFSMEAWETTSLGERAMLLAIIEEKLEAYFTDEVPHPIGEQAVPCVFCNREQLDIVQENELAFSVFDIHPAVAGHCLIIPKRHVRDVFGIKAEEIGAMLELLKLMKDLIEEDAQPDGYNIGFNVGYAAGQTVMHAHMHCFPRIWGDVDNPRGGLRNIIPNWFKYPKE